MPHKAAICYLCNKPLHVERIHPTMTAYHGECRLKELRRRWALATCDLERDIIQTEAAVVKHYTDDWKKNQNEA